MLVACILGRLGGAAIISFGRARRWNGLRKD
jgi:hypothetical protein